MRFFIIVFVLLRIVGFAQQKTNHLDLFNAIEHDILSYDNNNALYKIDSVLLKKYNTLSNSEKVLFKTLKVEALTKANLFDQSLKLSKELLSNPVLTTNQHIRILLNNALTYEYVGDFPSCKKSLDEIESMYNAKKNKKDKFLLYTYIVNLRTIECKGNLMI